MPKLVWFATPFLSLGHLPAPVRDSCRRSPRPAAILAGCSTSLPASVLQLSPRPPSETHVPVQEHGRSCPTWAKRSGLLRSSPRHLSGELAGPPCQPDGLFLGAFFHRAEMQSWSPS